MGVLHRMVHSYTIQQQLEALVVGIDLHFRLE